MKTKLTAIFMVLAIFICSSLQTFAAIIPDTKAIDGPAAVVFNNYLYIAWTDTDHKVKMRRSTTTSSTEFGSEIDTGETSNFKPALATANGKLYLAWTGTDGRVNVMTSTDGRSFQTKWILYEYSIAEPAMAGNPGGITVALAWTGPDKCVNRYLTSDGIKFSYKQTYTDATTNYGPAIVFNSTGSFIIAWTGADGYINVKQVNGVVTTYRNLPKSKSAPNLGFKGYRDTGYLCVSWVLLDNYIYSTLLEDYIVFGFKKYTELSYYSPVAIKYAGTNRLLWTGTDNRLNIANQNFNW